MNKQTRAGGATALHRAAYMGHLRLTQLLCAPALTHYRLLHVQPLQIWSNGIAGLCHIFTASTLICMPR